MQEGLERTHTVLVSIESMPMPVPSEEPPDTDLAPESMLCDVESELNPAASTLGKVREACRYAG
jgi:hypothetical protein